MTEQKIRCAAIWGGVLAADLEVSTNGLTACMHSSSADGQKGGDIYYFSVCGSDLLTRIALADVRGHGEGASQVSEWLYNSLQQRMNNLEGNGVLADLNRVVCERGFEAMTTVAVVGYYLGDSTLYFCYAGHPPVFLQRRNETEWRPLSSPAANLPLGVLPQAQYHQAQAMVYPGDRLFLYTDGVIECPNAAEEEFGEERLLEVLRSTSGRSLPQIKQSLLESLLRHTGGTPPPDDVTFMAIEIHGAKE